MIDNTVTAEFPLPGAAADCGANDVADTGHVRTAPVGSQQSELQSEQQARQPSQHSPLAPALLDLMALLEQNPPQAGGGAAVAELLARLLGADFCCVVLRERGVQDGLHISATASNGPLSITARRALIRGGSVIRRMLSPHDGDAPPGALAPVHEAGARRCALYVPFAVAGVTAGVLHVRRDGQQARAFSDHHAACARLAALLIGNAVQMGRLQGLLQSNYAQFALMGFGSSGARIVALPQAPLGEQGERGEPATGSVLQSPAAALADPHGTALRVARAFYRELRNARFDERQIIGAATEVIAQLGADMREAGRQRAGALSGSRTPAAA